MMNDQMQNEGGAASAVLRILQSAFRILHPDSMSQNSEQIEAKLCAYLEGELDEQGRAEIEKHLEQHPAHRKLLSEVGKTRGLLRRCRASRAAGHLRGVPGATRAIRPAVGL